MSRHDDLVKVAQLAGTSHRFAVEDVDEDLAVDELHAITSDSALLTQAAAAYTQDDADRYRQRAAQLLATAGADLVEARRIWDERARRGSRGLSGLGEQPG